MGFAVELHKDYCNDHIEKHSVETVLLSFVVKGDGKHYLQDNVYDEKPGNISITHYDQVHSITSSSIDIYNIFVDPQFHPLPILPGKLQDILSEIIPLHPNFYHKNNSIIRFQLKDIDGMMKLLDQISEECKSPGEGHYEMMRLYLKVFLMRLCREYMEQVKDSTPRRHSHPMEKVRTFIDDHYFQELNLPTLAKKVHMHPNSLSRSFKAHTGASFSDYLCSRRLQAAMIQLRTTNEKVLHIALNSGFQDISRFNKAFKQHIGETPRSYRKKFIRE